MALVPQKGGDVIERKPRVMYVIVVQIVTRDPGQIGALRALNLV